MMGIAQVTGKMLVDWAKWLKQKECGCCRLELITDDMGNIWSILMGWQDGYDESDEGEYQSGTWKICTKIGYQSKRNIMQSDFDIDFLMPYDIETGDVDDTCCSLPNNPDWDKLADELNKEAKRVINDWAYFEIEETLTVA